MVIDSSALLAITLAESDAGVYIDAIDRALRSRQRMYVPASVLIEAGIVADRRKWGGALDSLVGRLQPEIVPLDELLANLSRRLFRQFGRGYHAASLNFGDCMSYATAEHLGLPLLFKGADFLQTPVVSALQHPLNRA